MRLSEEPKKYKIAQGSVVKETDDPRINSQISSTCWPSVNDSAEEEEWCKIYNSSFSCAYKSKETEIILAISLKWTQLNNRLV